MLQIIALFDRRVKLELMFVVPIMRTLSLRRVLRYAREKMSERLDLLFEVPMIRASCERIAKVELMSVVPIHQGIGIRF